MKIEQKTYIEMNRNVLGKQIILCEIVEFVRLRKRVCWREFYFVGPGIISLSSIEGVFLQLHSQASYLYFLHIHFTYILSHIKFYEWKFVCECFFFCVIQFQIRFMLEVIMVKALSLFHSLIVATKLNLLQLNMLFRQSNVITYKWDENENQTKKNEKNVIVSGGTCIKSNQIAKAKTFEGKILRFFFSLSLSFSLLSRKTQKPTINIRIEMLFGFYIVYKEYFEMIDDWMKQIHQRQSTKSTVSLFFDRFISVFHLLLQFSVWLFVYVPGKYSNSIAHYGLSLLTNI